jgi:uncharacterized membrane protein YtjA (UPF0391 family)
MAVVPSLLSLDNQPGSKRRNGEVMLPCASALLAAATVIGLSGFGDVAATSASVAQVLFFIFLFLLVVSLTAHLLQRRGG